METVNAKIGQAEVGFEGHGILTFVVTFEWQSSAQGFPCYASAQDNWARIQRALQVMRVNTVSELKGKFCRIVRDESRVVAMGHIVEDQWLDWGKPE